MTFTTRFAPSPTGPLHLGHAYSALLAHQMATEAGGRFLLRIEDTGRKIKQEVFEMFKARQEGDLLMDAPEYTSWRELQQHAADVENWNARVRSLRQPRITLINFTRARHTRTSNRLAGRKPADAETTVATTAPTTTATRNRSKVTEARKYINRDEHESFLRPVTKEARKKRWVRTSKKKKKKPRGLTDKQRAAEAHGHYLVHHGTTAEVRAFLASNPRRKTYRLQRRPNFD